MYSTLTLEDLGDFLETPHLGVLATFRRDGSPILSPVFWEWRDGGFMTPVFEGDFKLLHVKRDPRASIVVAEPSLPYRGIEVTGTAQIRTDPGRLERIRSTNYRFCGKKAGEAMLDGQSEATVYELRVEGKVRCWNLGALLGI